MKAKNETENDLEKSIVSDIFFDDTLSIKKILFKIDNSVTECSSDLTNLHTLIFSHKLLNKVKSMSLNLNTIPSENLAVVKIMLILEINKINFLESKCLTLNMQNGSDTSTLKKKGSTASSCNLTSSTNKINPSDCNELIHTIFKLLIDEETNEVKISDLNLIIQIIFKEVAINPFNYEQFVNLVDGNIQKEGNNQTNGPNFKNSKITFESFLKYFKMAIYFYMYSTKYINLFNLLDFENKLKVLTAELIVCFNKILRNLEDSSQNMFSTFTKRFLDLIDNNEVFLSKSDFTCLLLKALTI